MNHAGMTDTSNSGMDHGDMSHDTGHDHSGHGSSFSFGDMRSSLLFAEWMPTTPGQLVGACFAVGFMTIFYFFLEHVRARLGQRHKTSELTAAQRLGMVMHWVHAALFCISFGWGYFLMLIAMSYNAWIFISIVIGAFFGYVFFGFTGQNLSCCN